jgi:fructose-1,6-bisphosphatase/inositol monophosphatase family enzyme
VSATHEQRTGPILIEVQPSPNPRASRGSLVAGLAMFACVAACALPALLAGGLVAGVGALVKGWNVIAVVILVATAGGIVVRRRRKRTADRC